MNTANLNNFNKKFTIVRSRTANTFSDLSNVSRFNFPRNYFNLPRNIRRNHVLYALVIVAILASFLFGRIMSGDSALNLSSDNRTEAPKPLATQNLNKEFRFPLKDNSGKQVSSISYLVESANLQNAFIYQGKVAKAVKGRTFLIFDLKITNPYTKTVEINAKDYIRIKVNNSSEQLAPEIHNDPVQVQARSTKYTRIGLPINDTDKNVVLLIGELQGKKQTIKLDLKI